MRSAAKTTVIQRQVSVMSDNTTSPADKAQLDKITDVLAALVDETRQSKVMISDVIAQRTQYAADIKDLKASIDTTRRALDPEQLGSHVADNIDHFMGPVAQNFVRAIEANSDSAKHNLNAAQQTITAAKEITTKADKLDMESRTLANIAERLEDRDQRSKWDWATLATAMLISAALAGAGAVFFTKQNLNTANFADAIRLIQSDDDAYWCGRAGASIVQDQNGAHYCAIAMTEYRPEEPAE
ncbi:hypothetical protein [Halovulum sp. GXIMD14793]